MTVLGAIRGIRAIRRFRRRNRRGGRSGAAAAGIRSRRQRGAGFRIRDRDRPRRDTQRRAFRGDRPRLVRNPRQPRREGRLIRIAADDLAEGSATFYATFTLELAAALTVLLRQLTPKETGDMAGRWLVYHVGNIITATNFDPGADHVRFKRTRRFRDIDDVFFAALALAIQRAFRKAAAATGG